MHSLSKALVGEPVILEGLLTNVQRSSKGRYLFHISNYSKKSACFYLSSKKAMILANSKGQYPFMVKLKVKGRKSGSFSSQINFAKIISIDGVDPRSWAERVGSPTVDPAVKNLARDNIEEQLRKEEETMRSKAPPDPTPSFSNKGEAFERGMFIIRRQLRMKDPKLSKDEIFQLRDALNILYDSSGINS